MHKMGIGRIYPIEDEEGEEITEGGAILDPTVDTITNNRGNGGD